MAGEGRPPRPRFRLVGKGVRMTVDGEFYIFRVDGVEICDESHVIFAGRGYGPKPHCPGKQPHPKTYWTLYRARLFDPDNLRRGYVQSFSAFEQVNEWAREHARSNVNERTDDAK